MEGIRELQAYAYFISTVLLVIGLYAYIWYLYTGKKRGQDYEKYSNLALNDELNDELVEERPAKEDDSLQTAEGKNK